MLKKTHFVIGLFIALYFLPHVNNKIIFFVCLMFFNFLPDLDYKLSLSRLTFGASKFSGDPNHRGFLHSYTFAIIVSVLLAFFYPLLALPFFLGYSVHLFADSFTVKGIKLFWPWRYVSSGKITTGEKMEDVVFWVFVLIDLFLIVFLIFQ